MYEVFEHTADLGLRVRAQSREELFAEAGRGLFSLVVPNLADVQVVETIELHLEGDDDEYLFFDWLNELLFTYESRKLLLAEFDVHFTPGKLHAVARGEPADSTRHTLHHEVKAITYHGLKVAEQRDGWLAEVIVDI